MPLQYHVATANLNLKSICNELATVAFKFFSIGVQLNVPFHKLKEFEKDDDPLPCLIHYVITNGVSENCPLSWHCIVEVLESESVDEPGLAREIAKKYCKSQGDSLMPVAASVYSEAAATSVISSHTSSGDSSYIPPPVDLASYFPYLSEKERKNGHYLQQLKDETEKMKRKFDGLVYDLIEDLKRYSTQEKVVTLLAIHCDCRFETQLRDCESLSEVFSQMKKFISFYDYGPIKLLTSQLASTAFKNKLKRYKKSFQSYAKRRICECPSDTFEDADKHEKTYVLKTELNIATLTLEEVEKLEYEMNKALGKKFLHLLSVKKGCVEFIFRAMEENKFLISEDQKKALKLLGVISVKYKDDLIVIQDTLKVVSRAVTKDDTKDSSSDSGIHTRETVDTTTKLSDFSESFIDKGSLYNRSTLFHKVKDLKDVRIDMMIKAESKPQDLPFQSQLHWAISSGNLRHVKQLIKENENPMTKDINGNSCLHYAAELHMFEILKYLIEEVQCPPGTEGWNGITILHTAAKQRYLDMVQYLVESEFCKLDPAITDESGYSALHCACQGGDLRVVKYLIECMKEYRNLDGILHDCASKSVYLDSKSSISEELFTQSLLACACFHGNYSVVRYLVEDCHCNPFLPQGTQQKVPIQSAVLSNNLDVIKYLAAMPNFSLPSQEPSLVFLAVLNASKRVIQYLTQTLHCDYNRQYKERAPIHVAVVNGRLDILDFFISVLKCDPCTKEKAGKQLIHLASSCGHVDIVNYLIKKHSVSATSSLTDDGDTPLVSASYSGHLAVVKYLTAEQILNQSSSHDNIALCFHAAASSGHVQIANYFVNHLKCDPNSKAGPAGSTPLHIAAGFGHLNFVKWLVEDNHCDVNSLDDFEKTPVQDAVCFGKLSVVKYLTKSQKCNITHTNIDGLNVVHIAAIFGQQDILKFLIEELGMDINVSDAKGGHTPVIYAATHGHLHVVSYLMKAGGKHDYLTLLEVATQNGHLDVVKYIINSPNFHSFDVSLISVYYFAIKNNHISIIKFLIEKNYCTIANENSLVHLAARYGHIDIVKYFIQTTKCELFALDENGQTPLHYAISNGHLELVRWYASQNKTNAIVQSDQTYLKCATYFGQLNITKYLVEELKCDYTFVLHFATRRGELDIIKYFVEEKKWNPGASCDDHYPINMAAYYGKINVIKYFIEELNCNPMPIGSSEKTPLHWAAAKNHLDVVKYLLEEHDCNPCSVDAWNSTPLFYAATKGHFKVVQYLICDKKVPFSIKFYF